MFSLGPAPSLASFTPSARPAYKNIYGIISWMETKSFFTRNKSRSDFSLSLAMEKIEGVRSCDAFLLSHSLTASFRLRWMMEVDRTKLVALSHSHVWDARRVRFVAKWELEGWDHASRTNNGDEAASIGTLQKRLEGLLASICAHRTGGLWKTDGMHWSQGSFFSGLERQMTRIWGHGMHRCGWNVQKNGKMFSKWHVAFASKWCKWKNLAF